MSAQLLMFFSALLCWVGGMVFGVTVGPAQASMMFSQGTFTLALLILWRMEE